MLCTPSVACGNGQHSAGVAILARTSVGLRWPEHIARGIVVPHRLIFAMIDLPGWPPILAGCAYMYTGEGLSKRNLHILKRAGEVLEGKHLSLFGADWNFSASVLEMSGMPRRASMVALQADVETCATPQANAKIDFFLASSAFSKLVESTVVDTTWPKRPHRPVQLQLRSGAVKLHQLVYQAHQRLPNVLPIGPTPEPVDWSVARAIAENANSEADFGDVDVALGVLGQAWIFSRI